MWQTIGVLGGVALGAGLTYWIQRSLATAAIQARWAERAADALADLEILLTDAHPDRVAFNMDRETIAGDVASLRDRGTLVRREVAVLAVGHPDATIRTDAKALQVGIFNALGSLGGFMRDMVQHADTDDSRVEALKDHGSVRELAEKITDHLHS
ncbi:MAG: hypothetical protein H0W97_02920 [Actinobacteria bacterium]|nr:hypothetical protein [Actinomycetota bacterium]